MNVVAIMQPTYLPWLGYFALMDRVDHFVFLDSVQFDRRSWQQRNRIKNATGPMWLTVPVLSKGRRDQKIMDVVIDRERNFPESHIRAMELNYKASPYFEMYAPEIFATLRQNHTNLVDLNRDLIQIFRTQLGITTPLMLSSEMEHTGTKADLLAQLCEQLHAKTYVSPPGSREYLDQSSAFDQRNIDVVYQEFTHPEYPQRFGPFIPFLSVVDLLFNYGSNSLTLIQQGYSRG